MRKILITGGTVFVSRFLAEYFVNKQEEVYVLNRNHHPQVAGVTLIEADRYALGETLKDYTFDVVIDVNAYTKEEAQLLVDALPEIKEYVFISTSAVYPETLPQPFNESQTTGPNKYWGSYGTNKIEIEEYLAKKVPQAYIIRPAYIYGSYNNAYREAFVFDCARKNRPFYIPQEGNMLLQFIHVADICRLIDELLDTQPLQKVYNAGNQVCVSIKEWVSLCYEIVGAALTFVSVSEKVKQSDYFSFPDYEYLLDVSQQTTCIGETIDLKEGLKQSWQWYQTQEEIVNKRDYEAFITQNIAK